MIGLRIVSELVVGSRESEVLVDLRVGSKVLEIASTLVQKAVVVVEAAVEKVLVDLFDHEVDAIVLVIDEELAEGRSLYGHVHAVKHIHRDLFASKTRVDRKGLELQFGDLLPSASTVELVKGKLPALLHERSRQITVQSHAQIVPLLARDLVVEQEASLDVGLRVFVVGVEERKQIVLVDGETDRGDRRLVEDRMVVAVVVP